MRPSLIIEAFLIAAAIIIGAGQIARALENVTVDMKSTVSFVAEDKGSCDGTP